MNKKFFLTTVAGCSFVFWLFRTAISGMLYAIFAFVTKEILGCWFGGKSSGVDASKDL